MPRLLIVILAFTVITACKKEKSLAEQTSTLEGNWELRKRVGGYSATGWSDYEPGNGNRLVFTTTTMSQYVADTLYRTENYSLVMDTCWATPGGPKMLPRFENSNVNDGSGVFLDVSPSKLIMYYSVLSADGYSLEYIRLPDRRGSGGN